MISTEVAENAQSVVNVIKDARLVVFAKPNSPVGLLASNLTVVDCSDLTTHAIRPLSNILAEAEESTRQAFDSVAEEISKALNNHLNYARNVVAPMVGEFAQAVIPGIDIATANELSAVEICQENLPRLASNSDLGVQRFEVNGAANLIRLSHDKSRTDQEVLDLMLVGKGSIDADIQEFYASLPSGTLSQVWDTFFTAKPLASSERDFGTGQLLTDPKHGLTRALIVYLVACKLSERAESDCNAPETVYTNLALDLRNQAGFQIKRQVSNYEMDVENGVLILGEAYPKIHVNGEVFRKYLLNGGSVDLILGRWLTRGTENTVKGLTAERDRYEKAWSLHCTKMAREADLKRHVATIQVLEASFPQFLYQQSEEIAPVHTRDKITQRFETLLRSKTPEQTKDVYEISLELLCYCLFDHTDAYKILSGVAKVAASSPKATPAECAAISTLEYLTTQMASCLTVVRKSSN